MQCIMPATREREIVFMKGFVHLLGLPALLLAGAVAAHTHLLRSVPADGSVATAAPTQLQLGFSEAATLTALSIQKNGESAPIRLAPVSRQPAANFTIDLPPLSAGSYLVNWRALSDDHHLASGSFTFTVQAR
jgi:methionine-rich copper-binding protein CopC